MSIYCSVRKQYSQFIVVYAKILSIYCNVRKKMPIYCSVRKQYSQFIVVYANNNVNLL